jgi:glycosyltransferase involved in cell wall biosynthesis
MRVLVVHNRYSSRVPSGENLAVDDEVRWLAGAGVEVERHEVSNDQLVAPGPLGRVRDGVEAVWSWSAAKRLGAAIDRFAPDLVHVHNLFPLVTASAPHLALRAGLPVVWTVHNRRVSCVAGGYFRDGAPCHECRPGWRVPGVVHRCYAGSVSASALVTAASSVFRARARRADVTPIAPSDAVRAWLGTAGFDPAKVRVKHNGVSAPISAPPLPGTQGDFLFLGRLARYKGVSLMLDAWRRADVDARLVIVGDGEGAGEVDEAARSDPRITWSGQVDPDAVGTHIAGARAVVVPSLIPETFGRVAAEAFAHSRPVITTGQGGLREIVDADSGWVTGTDVDAMARAFTTAAADAGEVDSKGRVAHDRWERLFSPQATTRHLVEIYSSILSRPRPAPTAGAL